MSRGLSAIPTAYAVICKGKLDAGCGRVYLTKQEYSRQMLRVHDFWRCPQCGSTGLFDDNNLEEWESRDQVDEG